MGSQEVPKFEFQDQFSIRLELSVKVSRIIIFDSACESKIKKMFVFYYFFNKNLLYVHDLRPQTL